MRYLVVLRLDSPMGLNYIGGNHEGTVAVGKESYPFIDCAKLEEKLNYLFVTREMRKPPPSTKHLGNTQTLFIPHSAVAFIVCYDVADPAVSDPPNPIGFVWN
jgi:hypothetical protein